MNTSTPYAISLLSILLTLGAAAPADAGELRYYPPVAYRGEAATFVASAPAGTEVAITQGDTNLATGSTVHERLELFPVIHEAGPLSVRIGERSFTFEVVHPGTTLKLEARAGVLYAGNHPAILLPEHRHPPKHDRRWETVTFLGDRLRDSRLKAESVTIAAPPTLPIPATEGFTIAPLASNTVYSVHALASALPQPKPGHPLLIATSADDLEHAMPPLTFTMSVEWILQALQARGASELYLAPPIAATHQQPLDGRFIERLRLAARSNRAHYLFLHELALGEPASVDTWLAAAREELLKTLRWK